MSSDAKQETSFSIEDNSVEKEEEKVTDKDEEERRNSGQGPAESGPSTPEGVISKEENPDKVPALPPPKPSELSQAFESLDQHQDTNEQDQSAHSEVSEQSQTNNDPVQSTQETSAEENPGYASSQSQQDTSSNGHADNGISFSSALETKNRSSSPAGMFSSQGQACDNLCSFPDTKPSAESSGDTIKSGMFKKKIGIFLEKKIL